MDVVCTDRGTHPRRTLVALHLDVFDPDDWWAGTSVRTGPANRDWDGVGPDAECVPTPSRAACPTCGRQVNRTWPQLRAAAVVVDELDISRV